MKSHSVTISRKLNIKSEDTSFEKRNWGERGGGAEMCWSAHQKEENIASILQIETFILVSYISTITFWALCCLHQKSEIQSDYYLQVTNLTAIRYRQEVQWQPEVLTPYTDSVEKNTSLGTKKMGK